MLPTLAAVPESASPPADGDVAPLERIRMPGEGGGRYRENMEWIKYMQHRADNKRAEYRKAARFGEDLPSLTACKWEGLVELHRAISVSQAAVRAGTSGADALSEALLKRGRERSFAFLAPTPMMSAPHFTSTLMACFDLDPVAMSGPVHAVLSAASEGGGGEVDYRSFLCCLMFLDQPRCKGRGSKLLTRFFDVFDHNCTRSVPRDDVRKLLHVFSGSMRDRQVADSILDRIDGRHGGVHQPEITLPDFSSVLFTNPQIVTNLEEMSFARLPKGLQISVLRQQAEESEEVVRDHENRIKLERFKRYFTTNSRRRVLLAWGSLTRRKLQSRARLKLALALFRKREGARGLVQWHGWAASRWKVREYREKAATFRTRQVARHCTRAWKAATQMALHLEHMGELRKAAEYVHAVKNMERLWYRLLEAKLPTPKWAFPIWREEARFVSDVSRASAMLQHQLQRSMFDVWVVLWKKAVEVRWLAEVDAMERQRMIADMMEEGDHLRQDAEAQEEAELCAAREKQQAEEEAARAYQTQVDNARLAAERRADEVLILNMQREDRKKCKGAKMAVRLAAFHLQWDALEEESVAQAQLDAEAYIALKKGSKSVCRDKGAQNMIDKKRANVIDLVISPVHNKEERERLTRAGDAGLEVPREGQLVWQIRMDPITLTKYFRNVLTDQKVTPEDCQHRGSQRITRTVARELYVSECMVVARRTALEDRKMALTHLYEVDAATAMQRCYRRQKKRALLKKRAWANTVHDQSHRKKLSQKAAVQLQRRWRGLQGRKAYLEKLTSCVTAGVHPETGHIFYFDQRTGTSSWAPPPPLKPADIEAPPDWALRRDHKGQPYYFNSR